jgi:hypothetical protein
MYLAMATVTAKQVDVLTVIETEASKILTAFGATH